MSQLVHGSGACGSPEQDGTPRSPRVTHTSCSQPTLTQASRFYLNIQLVLFVEYITGKYSHSDSSINVIFPCAL